ncbi:MAG TPA: MBL fold metallo-hydrolase [bacterium]|nr:MBL fold metallo-hydrolase [bacterium]
MKVKFWGVRGSVPTPGPTTVKYGGNTSCVEIITKSGDSIILDAGTGIRSFGMDYLKRENTSNHIHVLVSHVHWDHIQGFPFFIPAFLADMKIDLYSGGEVEKWLKAQMTPPYHPVKFEDLDAEINMHIIDGRQIEVAGCLITPFPLNHPQDVFGFHIWENGKTVVYSTDTEYDEASLQENYIETIKGSDLLMYDAQYTPEEYSKGRIGWGHSTYEGAVEIAKAAEIDRLVLFHHEPNHDDALIDNIEKDAKALFSNTVAAREGMVIEV